MNRLINPALSNLNVALFATDTIQMLPIMMRIVPKNWILVGFILNNK